AISSIESVPATKRNSRSCMAASSWLSARDRARRCTGHDALTRAARARSAPAAQLREITFKIDENYDSITRPSSARGRLDRVFLQHLLQLGHVFLHTLRADLRALLHQERHLLQCLSPDRRLVEGEHLLELRLRERLLVDLDELVAQRRPAHVLRQKQLQL